MRVKKHVFILIISILFIITNLVGATSYYMDVFGHWAEETIMWATNEVNLFNGYEDGCFKPDDGVTRAEYITLLYRVSINYGIIQEYQKNETSTINSLMDDNKNTEQNSDSLEENSIELDTELDESKKDDNKVNNSKDKVENKNLESTDECIDICMEQNSNSLNNNCEEEQNNLEYLLNYEDIDSNFWAFYNIKSVCDYINDKNNNIRFEHIFPGNKFNPDKRITREEAAILSSFFISPPIKNLDIEFKDITTSYKYYNQIRKLVDNKIIVGYSDNTFRTNMEITRAEAATIIRRIYVNMDFMQKNYINEIKIINDIFDNKFEYFGNYSGKQITSQDAQYTKAVSTLEYKSMISTIPYEEKDYYDPNPIQTLEELKLNNYWNITGVNYYLIEYCNLDKEKEKELLLEMLSDYNSRDDLQSNEIKMLFDKIIGSINVLDDILIGLDKWNEIVTNKSEKLNIIFLKSKTYLENNQYEQALKLYNDYQNSEEFNTLDLYNKKYFIVNKAFVLSNYSDYKIAIELLNTQIDNINNNEEYQRIKDKFQKSVEEAGLFIDSTIYCDNVYAEMLQQGGYITRKEYIKYRTFNNVKDEFIGCIKQILINNEKDL